MNTKDIILKAMLENKDRIWWSARDFQSGKYFVGYEATARMSELVKMFPDMIIWGKDGRYRVIRINWECEKTQEQMKRIGELSYGN